jgi:hypothetical protein
MQPVSILLAVPTHTFVLSVCRFFWERKYKGLFELQPITVAALSKTWTVFSRLNTGVVGSNRTRGMDVYVRLFCVCVVLCVGRFFATGCSPIQGVLPIVYRIKKLKKRPRSEGL